MTPRPAATPTSRRSRPRRTGRVAGRLREPRARRDRQPARRAEPVPAQALTWLCRAYGSTTIRRAYADWADPRFGRYQQALERNGIDLVQLGHGPARKNGADIRMAVDAMETLIIHPSVDAFVLVSGDSDFSPLVAKLREHGKHVTGVGAETAASARLVSVCSEFKLFGSIVARLDPPAKPANIAATAAPAATPDHRLADAEALLVTAMEQITAATPTASQVKSKMWIRRSTRSTTAAAASAISSPSSGTACAQSGAPGTTSPSP